MFHMLSIEEEPSKFNSLTIQLLFLELDLIATQQLLWDLNFMEIQQENHQPMFKDR